MFSKLDGLTRFPAPLLPAPHVPQYLKTVSQLLMSPGGFQTRFGTQKLPREATPAAVSQSAVYDTHPVDSQNVGIVP